MLRAMLPLLLVLAPLQEPIPVREVLAIESLGVRERSPVSTDSLEAALSDGSWQAPSEGQTVLSATGEARTWKRVEADENGGFGGAPFRGGWAWTRLEVPATARGDGAWRLDVSGPRDVLVDGDPHAGDVYQLGITRIPLALAPGPHELLFRNGRGALRATLEPAPAPVYLEEKDRTLPDVIRGEGGPVWIGAIVANATAEHALGYRLRARFGARESVAEVPALLPSGYRKCGLAVAVPVEPTDDALEGVLELLDVSGEVVHATPLRLAVKSAHTTHSRTFVSAIDGSVQYYSVVPPPEDAEREGPPALVLSLHGATVEARGQAACYRPRDWAVIVAPTNRRPYGFDWEDQGRQDAFEVLELAAQRFGTDPGWTLLTGHSMGGHGTWQLGAHFPDRFAAIAPSAGWKDFWSYTGPKSLDPEDPIGALLVRAANASRTGLLASNYANQGVYVLHGDADETVPVDEARAMRTLLAGFHPDFAYYERPGAGHWWGNQCLDWPPLMEFLKSHRAPDPTAALDADFVTVDAAVSSRFRYLAVVAQNRTLEPSRVSARYDRREHVLRLELDNVQRLAIDPAPFAPALGGAALRVAVDGEPFEVPVDAEFHLGQGTDGHWQVVTPLAPWYKNARRAGPFKAAFRHHFLLVYGTRGTPEENAWALGKARYDHEQWRYRGNGAVDVLADVDFNAREHPDRDVILYGNQDTNAAWSAVVAMDRGLELRRAVLRFAGRELTEPDLALLMVYPRADSDVASVGIVGHTGIAGARATTFLPYFVSGVGYPDWTVLASDSLREGLAGVRGAGFFRSDWSMEAGAEGAWR
jgi:poly(3-hydroxybutyrate) depolymerase